MGAYFTKSDSNVTTDVKQQGNAKENEVYKLVDLNGGGDLVEMTKKGRALKDFSELDNYLMSDAFKSLLYNDGAGKKVPLIEIVNFRDGKDYNKDSFGLKSKGKRTLTKVDLLAVNGKGNYLYNQRSLQPKEVCWKIDKRGTVGETILHLCFLNSSTIHADLAKRLLHLYPKLINDIYLGDMYYGENVLHIAIVNEDPAMVKFLLDNGADVDQRCCGSFFCPSDQKDSRSGSADREWFAVSKETNYEGYTYWGESALSFAACLGQEECVRLLVAKKADLNFQDANGNTVLHMLVIYDKQEMFEIVHGLGAKLNIKNRQDLTPLTMAARLARKEMYERILEIEREDYWMYGSVTCAGYPLEHTDTISMTGEINKHSALHLIVYGEKAGHLNMMDGLVVNLLKEKWSTFISTRFYRRFITFLLYFLTFVVAFLLRPGTDLYPSEEEKNVTDNGNATTVMETTIDPCYLMKAYRTEDIARFVVEIIIYISSCIYIFLAMKEIYHQGFKMFFNTLRGAPAKALFLLSCVFVMMMLPGRASCAYQYEDVLGVLAILCTAPYFLFFCRGFRIVGPFVVMIYNMIRGDLLRFFMIYAVFVIGFSQAMFIVFAGVDGSVFSHPIESMMGMFIMSLGEFGDIYDSFLETKYPDLGRLVFLVYMIMVTLLLVNMLIAMMGNTYQLVNETQKEWFRQWAKIVLVVEQSVTTEVRIQKQMAYSQPMSNDENKRVLVSRWHQTEKEKELIKQMKEEAKIKDKVVSRKRLPSTMLVTEDQNIDARMGHTAHYTQH